MLEANGVVIKKWNKEKVAHSSHVCAVAVRVRTGWFSLTHQKKIILMLRPAKSAPTAYYSVKKKS